MEQLIETTTGSAAFKDWAISCAALGEGKQVMLFRKAGLAENKGEFKVEHPRFFLYPTWIHQTPQGIKSEYHVMLKETLSAKPPEGKNRIEYWAQVEEAVIMKDMQQIQRQSANHVWSEATTVKRWNWEPDRKFWLLLMRVYRLKQPLEIDLLESYSGCFSWFNIQSKVEGLACEPVLSDAQWNEKADLVRNAL